MGAIEDVYADLDAEVSEEEFREAVEQKVEQMGGLADEETAAMLIAHELSENEVNGIADIETGMDEVKFLAKVTSIGELRTFERDGEDEDGHVINVEAADETGQVRLAFWDEQARSIDEGELQEGQVLRVKGRPKDGYNGLEVSVDKAEPDEDAEVDVDLDGTTDIDSLSMGQSDVNVQGIVLGTESVRTFDRDDGSEGRVANLTLGDESGRIRVTLWDDRADRAEQLDAGTPVEVVDGYVRERDGDLELHVGDRGAVEEIDHEIDFSPDTDAIDSVEIEQTVDLGGVVRSADPKRTFDRDDGSEGQVRNVRIQDDTGDIRVALWGEKADIDLGPGDEVFVADAEIQDGWQDDLEASAGWGSTVVILEDGSSVDSGAATNGDADGDASTGLDAFADDRGTEDAGGDDDTDSGNGDEQIELTGTVVQTGDPVIVDDGEETISVETDEHVQLGQQVTVRGQRRADRVEAEELF
ncbi:single-stranded DNA binding protein [Halapricum hydrolyticum]|uniref:Single-stranded DNA binding protein n=1 Tax=Halapricum hydrolyticum TaxID=2979991 RepID=A0AAE3ICM5_9EURY|nr:single-stranded DNA binding protein [Halapricum hydrolyticum]MCU4718830.1 single-stranded DNA binding protein [Halapricum hydrolyticum]MCU4727762.1 single-stranded DNA binding protein [Halapricum hydrolyticum]